MIEMTPEYWNELANHFILISALLAGFSIAFIANLIVSDTNNRISTYLQITATIAASSFLISVFSMTTILMMTTKGYPLEIEESKFHTARIIGGVTFMIGIIALSTLIALSGWTKSKTMGILTTIIGILTLVMVLIVS
ncbi:hypothetical protein [Zobellia sp. B3R18]|uniref:hypothetical protein n=1 Tax=Zobellia sp. B3R18 TaxID=2841568 RepID=UPI001C0783C3|nr:hypothetical protein [Zobellia sp. B3R18]MBU2974596.1 hypothetical protein [Zobellia sp. B3R18]